MRILVVEDEPKVARLLERGLRQQSYAVLPPP
jgi:DNA-binding response OmpR family regulator